VRTLSARLTSSRIRGVPVYPRRRTADREFRSAAGRAARRCGGRFALALVVAIAANSSDDAFIGFIFAMVPVYEIPLVAFFGCTVGKLWPSRIRVVAVKNGRPPGLFARPSERCSSGQRCCWGGCGG